jgi:hypothetical protein
MVLLLLFVFCVIAERTKFSFVDPDYVHIGLKSSLVTFYNATPTFLSRAGVLTKPILGQHYTEGLISEVHAATLMGGEVRGNHMHLDFHEVITMVHGYFLVRVAKEVQKGIWNREDHFLKIDSSLATPSVPSSPYDYLPSYSIDQTITYSSSPISLDIPPHVCHALMAINTIRKDAPSFFSSYYVVPPHQTVKSPDREVCRNEKMANLEFIKRTYSKL